MSRNLIDRDVLLEKAKQEQRFYKDEYDAMESGYLDEEREIVKEAYSTMTDCVSLINNAPTIDAVEVKHGEWIKGIHMVECSVCSEKFDFGDETWVEDFDICEDIGWKYCPHCGAKMNGERRDPCS